MEFDIQERSKRCIGDTCHGILSLRIWMTHHESTERVSSCDLNFLPGRKTLHGLYCSDKVLRHLRLWNPHIPRFNSEPHQKESLAAMAWFFLLVLAAKSWAVRMVCISRPTYWVTTCYNYKMSHIEFFTPSTDWGIDRFDQSRGKFSRLQACGFSKQEVSIAFWLLVYQSWWLLFLRGKTWYSYQCHDRKHVLYINSTL